MFITFLQDRLYNPALGMELTLNLAWAMLALWMICLWLRFLPQTPGDSTIQVKGVFTLLGTPHEITVPIQVQLGGANAIAKAHFVVPYVQWGLKNPSFMIWKADNDVAIDLNLVGTISK